MPEQREDELDLSGTKTDGEKKAQRGRPSAERVRTDLGKSIREGLDELGDWISERDPELGGILKRDASRMANVLAGRAAKHQRVAKGVERVFGADGPIGVLRAFGPFLRALLERLPVLPFPSDELPSHPEDQLATQPPPVGDV